MTRPVAIRGATAMRGHLAGGESIEERVFTTVTACLESAGLERDDIDAVVIAADDLADGRSITTMLHATAAGAYLKDEIRTTNGGLVALGLGALRIAAGYSKVVLVVGWWLPTADDEAIARASIDARGGRLLVGQDQLAPVPTVGACGACVLSEGGAQDGMPFHGFAFGQSDYDSWLLGTNESDRLISRVGAELRGRVDAGQEVACVARCLVGSWGALVDAIGIPAGVEERVGNAWHGLADGLVILADIAAENRREGATLVATTGVPAFLQAEAAMVGSAA